MKSKTVMAWALKDISDYLNEHIQEFERTRFFDDKRDKWIFFPHRFEMSKTVYLNRKLGLRNVNYGKHNMNRNYNKSA